MAAVLSAGLVTGLAVPLATLAAKAVLFARWRRDPDPRRHGSTFTFLVLVAPSFGAVLWFVSAALHLSEPGAAVGVCTLDHLDAGVCADALLFALILSALLAAAVLRAWWCQAGASRIRGARLPSGDAVAMRLRKVCGGHPRLRGLRHRIVAVDGGSHPICTHGFLRPIIVVDRRLVEQLDDESLAAALLHEAAHREMRDPLRYLIARASLAINPCGFLLRRELGRWRAGLEAVCDEWAVRWAADPLALADALVAAARLQGPVGGFAAGLGGSEQRLLQLRVHLLLDYVSRPHPRPPTGSRGVVPGAALAVAALPHVLGAWPLNLAHTALEQALGALGAL